MATRLTSMRTLALAGATVLLASLVAACGDRTSTPGDGSGPWQVEHLEGEAGPDQAPVLVTDGDDALVVAVDEDGTLRSNFSDDGAEFAAGKPVTTGAEGFQVADAVRLADGDWYLIGSGFDDLRPVAFRSSDGLTWHEVAVTGFRGPTELTGLAVADGGVVAVGVERGGKHGEEVSARAWHSTDGVAFVEVRLPGVPPYRSYGDESIVTDVLGLDDGLLAVGRVSRAAAMWRSSDGGATWQQVDDAGLGGHYQLTGLAVAGEVLVASVAGGKTQAVRSVDGGTTWEPVAALPASAEAEGWAPIWDGGDRVLTLVGIDDMSWSRPEVCYADLDACGDSPEPGLVASTDGEEWLTVDTTEFGEVDEIAGTADGRLLVLTGHSSPDVHTWPAGTPLPEADEPATPPTTDVRMLSEDEEAEVGVRYAAPMYIHCGMDWFWFGDATWRRTDDGPDVETGAGDDPPADWPVKGQVIYGYATVDADGVLSYTTEAGEVIATYRQEKGAPMCG